MHDVATFHRRLGRYDEAEPLFSRVAALRLEVLGETSKHTHASMMGLATVFQQQGRFVEAESKWLEVHDLIESNYGADSSGARFAVGRIAALYEAWGKADEAADWRGRLEQASDEGSESVRDGATDRQ